MVRKLPEALSGFLGPYCGCLPEAEQRRHAGDFCEGLLSNVNRKNTEMIAYEHDQDRHQMQHFIGGSTWDHAPLIDVLCRQVGEELGEPDGVLVIDPSGILKQGKKSVGVARQWCGRVGKVTNCQVGVFLAYVSRREHALCDFRLYLPDEWTKDRKRCRAAGVPESVRFQTRHELALEMIRNRKHVLPHAWVTADDEFGKVTHFRRDLHEMGERYVLAIPGNITARVLESEEIPHSGPGGPTAGPFHSVTKIRDELPATAWQRIEVRDGEKGPLQIEMAIVPHVQTKIERCTMKYAEVLIFTRYRDANKTHHEDFYLSDAATTTPAAEFARVISAERRVEETIRRAKSEAGMAGYQVRTWQGWHHHIALSLIATWFLVHETLAGRKTTPPLTVPQVRQMIARTLQHEWNRLHQDAIAHSVTRQLQRNEDARYHHYKKHNRLPPLRSEQLR
jgi:SRSO17 transposase